VFCFQALHLVVLWESLSIKRLGGFDDKNADKNSALSKRVLEMKKDEAPLFAPQR